MTEDRRNFVLFVAVAALILFGWPLAQGWFFPTANPPVTTIVKGKEKPVANPAADPTADSPAAIRDRQLVLRESPRVRIDTPRLKGSINLKGARIDDLVLVDYKETIAKNSPPIRLLSPSGAPEAYFAGFDWQGEGLGAPGADTVWRASAPVLKPGQPVTLAADGAGGQRFRITIAVDDRYMFTVRQSVGNAGARPVTVASYGYVSRVGESKDPSSWQSHTGPMSVHGGKADYDLKFKDVEAGAQRFGSTGGWLGFADKYWLTALVPDQGRSFDGEFRADAGPAGARTFKADYASAPVTLAPGRAVSQTSRFFAGAKEVKTLQAYQDQGVPMLDKAIDWGWFEVVEKPIFQYLDWLFRLVGNFGVAIVLLTLTIRGLMFPIAQKQFASMAQMKVLQPKMKALQERYKDDKARQQQEIMALYKAEKANPLAGCLPTVLQIPIFYALYKVLMLSIEMRHQPFALWIRDLSAPDPLTPVNLFGMLPFNPPGFLHLGVLAILLGVTMWGQMKLNPAQGDPATKQVMTLMPWIMMFFFASFAAGLQLYYVASNCLTILQQSWLYSRHPQLKTAPAR